MFKKKCNKCQNKVKSNFDFCPNCGNDLRGNYDKDDYGLIGKNDVFGNPAPINPFGNSFMEKMLNNAMKELPAMMKMLEKQMNEEVRPNNNSERKMPSNLNIQFYVNGKKILPGNNNEPKQVKVAPKIKNNLSAETKQIISKLPREEPKSKIRRMDGKVIYEFSVPGVENINNVLINQLENSIEVKAVSEDKVYSKTLNIKLPILGYNLNEGNLILELAQNQ